MHSMTFTKKVLTISFIAAASASSTDNNNDEEARKYSTLPPTVFSPGGRLFGVERVAREAILYGTTQQVDEESSCCTVFAVRCGGRSSSREQGEFAIMVGIGPISPFLHRDFELYQRKCQQDDVTTAQKQHATSDNHNEADVQKKIPFPRPLVLEEYNRNNNTTQSFSTFTNSLPIAILSPTLVTAAGGAPMDSSILLRRSIEVALSFYKLDNGGIDLFVSQSLEGMEEMTPTIVSEETTTIMTTAPDDDDDDLSQGIITPTATRGGGGASGVKIESLVRRIADMAQSSTQNLGGKYGRMLSSSLLAMGVAGTNDTNGDNDELCIWRVDPTGQFWKCEAAAVGRGTVEVEAELLSRVRQWKNIKKITEKTGGTKLTSSAENVYNDDILIEDIRFYLSSMTEEEAVKVASDCLVNGIMNCQKVGGCGAGGAASSSLRSVNMVATAPAAISSQQGDGNGGNNNNNISNKSYEESNSDASQKDYSYRGWMEYDLRRRIQCVVLRGQSCVLGGSIGNKILSKSNDILRW